MIIAEFASLADAQSLGGRRSVRDGRRVRIDRSPPIREGRCHDASDHAEPQPQDWKPACATRCSRRNCDVIDDSHLHAGHAGAADGHGHFTVQLVAERFAGLPVVRRHRLVYEAVGDMMTTDIHALSIQALAPGEGSLA